MINIGKDKINSVVEVFAHRGFSGPHPEMTIGAFTAAIDLARERDARLGIECDVHFTADGELGCLHDAGLERTAGIDEPMINFTLADLARIDFGRWRTDLNRLTDEDRQFTSLRRLFELVRDARADGVDVHLAVENKHPVPRDTEVEDALAALLTDFGWDADGAPVRMITFDPSGLARMRASVPSLPLTYLIASTQAWPYEGVTSDIAIGASAQMLQADPTLADRIVDAGHECHVWTVNEPADIRAALDLGLTALTTDHPDRVLDAIDSRG
ncbi:MAG: hypothetical protein L0G99_14380 [Propionibacteriales bacterium]|nr:hypothetical protein [Propionibacteriales bacterium]